ncbi:MAG: carbohydrate-binding domain-containing protein, partial [Planctomycetota bacterium]
AAFWITNPTNTFVGNISAGGGGTGFWYALPRTALGKSATKPIYDDVIPIFAEFGQFDNNASHSTAVGLNFDRGSDIEDGNLDNALRTNHTANEYSPRTDPNNPGSSTTSYVNGFTNYKSTDAAVYHRGKAETIRYSDLRIADSYNAAWAVSETEFDNSLYVGHSRGNADLDAQVGGPRLYDGSGLHTNAHFAGFADDDAYTFQVEGSSFGPTMYHGFLDVSFENDGTCDHLAHAVSDATTDPGNGHDLSKPAQWIKASMDIDGSLTGAAGGGIGYTIVPNVDFLVEDTDVQPAGWDAWLTDDIYARMRVENNNDGEELFPSDVTGEPLVRFTARDGDSVDVMAGQNNGNHSWTQIAAKTDGDGFVEGTFTVEFMRNGLPENGFVLNMKNQDGGRPELDANIQSKVNDARIVVKIVGAENYTPNQGTLAASEDALRSTTTGVAYFRDGQGNLLLNTGIKDSQPLISLSPGAPLQTAFVSRTVDYGATIEAEEFDNGIDGIAYHDSDGTNSLGAFRSNTGVDATSTMVGDIADGEWLEYTANITPAAYDIGVNVSSTTAGGQIRVLAANSNTAGFLRELGTINVPDTGGTFATQWINGVDLTPLAGSESVIRLEFVGGGFEVDSIAFQSPQQSLFIEERTITTARTERIELEEFDLGGQGVAYFDTSPGNETDSGDRMDQYVET